MDYKKVWEYLKGKKTYIVSGLFVIVTGLNAEGLITPDQYELILALLGFAGLASLRHGMTTKK